MDGTSRACVTPCAFRPRHQSALNDAVATTAAPADSAARVLPRPPMWWIGEPVAYTASGPSIPVRPASTALRRASTRWVSGTRLGAPVVPPVCR